MKKERANHYIEDWRRFRGFTQSQLATLCGVSQSNIASIEGGATGYTQQSLERIASAFYIEPVDLLKTDPFEPVLNVKSSNITKFMSSMNSLGEREEILIAELVNSMRNKNTLEPRKRCSTSFYFAEWRQFRGLTQNELAEKMGVSQSNVNLIENGKIAYTQWAMEKMALVLRIEPYELLGVDPYDPELVNDDSDDETVRVFKTLDADRQKIVLRVLKNFVDLKELKSRSRQNAGQSHSPEGVILSR